MGNIIKVYAFGSNGDLISFSYDGNNFSRDTAEQSVRNHGFTVVYSTMVI